jgi:hypothetical protein
VGRRTLLLLRWSVFILACAFLWWRLAPHGGTASLLVFSGQVDANTALRWGPLLLAMMVLNWWLESVKWRRLVGRLEPMAGAKAFLATLAGTPIGLITPNRVGEFVGRVLFLNPGHRVEATFATVVGSIAQFVVTVVCGTLALALVLLRIAPAGPDPWMGGLAGACVVVSAGALVLYFQPWLLRPLVARLPVVRRWEAQARVLEQFGPGALLQVLGLSLLRYAVFATQFIIVLAVLTQVPTGHAAAMVPVAFLIATLIPSVMLTELGVRGSVAVAVLSTGEAQDQPVFLASVVLWAINVGVPAMAGALVLLTARIRSSEDG